MGKTKFLPIVNILGGVAAIVRLLCSLFIIWLGLGWKMRKARKAFEKELIKQGISEKDAKRISARYVAFKSQLIDAFKRSFHI